MIPQDPTLFTGTLRYNLDPFDEQPDERIIELVKKAGLAYLFDGTSQKETQDKENKEEVKNEKKEKKYIESESEDESTKGEISKDEEKKEDEQVEEKNESDKVEENKEGDKVEENKDGAKVEPEEAEKKDEDEKKEDEEGKGLKFKIQEEGKNLSVGERQLICIIRAILRHNRIVLLDEATANIDVVTEQAIQKLISEEFADATVLTIAHRLNTIIKSDKVLHLSKGTVLEYDSP